MKEIDGYWASWFAGFTDGEGCFVIGKQNCDNPCADYQCQFHLRLRDDDKQILEEIRDTLGIGKICNTPADTKHGYNKRPGVVLRVSAIKDCVALVNLFDKYPLRAKKRRDYEIWREAVFELQRPVDLRDSDMLEYYFQMIREVRRYDEQEDLTKPITINLQLSFID